MKQPYDRASRLRNSDSRNGRRETVMTTHWRDFEFTTEGAACNLTKHGDKISEDVTMVDCPACGDAIRRATCCPGHEVKGYMGERYGLIYFTNGVNVFRASPGTVADVSSGFLQGRYECTNEHWNQFCEKAHFSKPLERCVSCGGLRSKDRFIGEADTRICINCQVIQTKKELPKGWKTYEGEYVMNNSAPIKLQVVKSTKKAAIRYFRRKYPFMEEPVLREILKIADR